MANSEHVKILKQGTEAWNNLRSENINFKADLANANFNGANLAEAALDYADLIQSNFRNAKLQRAGFFRAKLLRADLGNANLQGARFENAHLEGATLCEANLEEVNFRYADLQGANLFNADLRGADLLLANLEKTNLIETNFREAILQGVKFKESNGLQAWQIAGADVSGADLPEEIAKFEGLSQVKEISQRAQKLFLSLLLGCVYCWLTIATTTDVALITNSGSSPLPIIQTKMPIAYFYWAAPLILLSLYFWFHLYLQRFWERLAKLPAVFTDGEALDEKVYPWLISGMVRSHVRLLTEHRPALSRIQSGISIFLAWWIVPLTFLFFWLRYIPRHDWVGTSLHVGVLAVSITAAILLYRLAAKTLRGEETFSVSWKEKWKRLPAYQPASLTLGILGFFLFAFFNFSTWAIERVGEDFQMTSMNSWKDFSNSPPQTIPPYEWHDGPILFPRLLDYFGYRTYANLEEVDISTKPPNWTGQEGKRKDEVPLVKGAKLKGANLHYANMVGAFLINADLREANLQKAILLEANLQGANLLVADLQKAVLMGTNLQEANLEEANLQGAYLLGAKLQKANLAKAKLQKAQLAEAQLQEGYLTEARLQEAYLFQAILQKANLAKAKLQRAHLAEADLSDANLQEANLEEANLQGANLRGANLRRANLTKVKKFTQDQLNQACGDEYTQLPKGLSRPKPCPKKELTKK